MLELDFLEYPVTTACNLQCSCCDHAAGIIPPSFIPMETIFSDLSVLVGNVHVDTFKITGGEALLHPDIFNIVYFLKKSGICRKVALLTNGILLASMDNEIWKYIDVLMVSIYPDVHISMNTSLIIAKCLIERVQPQIKIVAQHTKRLLTVPNTPEKTEQIFNECKIRSEWGCHAIHRGLFYLCSVSQILPSFLAASGIADASRSAAVPLCETEEIKELLDRRFPMDCCRYCSGTSGDICYHFQRKNQ